MIKNILLKIKNKSKAFTLVEFLIYFSILAIIMVIIGSTTFEIISNKTKLETIQEVNQNARMAVEVITSKIHNAQSINTPIIGETSSSLSLNFSDSQKNPTIIDTNSGKLQITEGLGSPTSIVSSGVTIDTISFTNVSYPDTPGAMRISLTISSSSTSIKKAYSHRETFYTTATIRPK